MLENPYVINSVMICLKFKIKEQQELDMVLNMILQNLILILLLPIITQLASKLKIKEREKLLVLVERKWRVKEFWVVWINLHRVQELMNLVLQNPKLNIPLESEFLLMIHLMLEQFPKIQDQANINQVQL